MKTNILYGIVEKSKTRVECILCGVCIPKAKRCIEQHAHGARHTDTVEMMTENGIRYADNKLQCKLCCQDIEGETVQKHVEHPDHSTWMATVMNLVAGECLNLMQYFKNDQDEILCEVCNCPFKFSLQAIEQHVNWFNHRSNLADKLKPLNALFPVENDKELWCKICNAYIANDTASILDHIDHDDEHNRWFEDMDDYLHHDRINIDEYLSTEHKLTAFCEYCNIEVMCDLFSLEYHTQGEVHLNHITTPAETLITVS